jgi:hypothetical protein
MRTISQTSNASISGRVRTAVFLLIPVLLAAPLRSQSVRHDSASMHPGNRASDRGSDSAFAALQRRGKLAMGVDQYASTHHFTRSSDGGRIVLETRSGDSAGISRIRHHMREIAHAFATGDFSTPMFVHMRTVPGTVKMAQLRSAITYTPQDLPRGGALQIVTHDPIAIAAVHQFIAFQQQDHRASPEH